MSTLKTGALRGTSGTADSVQLHASNQSVTFPGDVTVTGALTSSSTITQNLVDAPTDANHYTWTGIPSTAKEIRLLLYNIVPSGSTSNLWLQVGGSSIQTSGYGTISGYIKHSGNQTNGDASHTGASSGAKFMLAQDWSGTDITRYGSVILRRMGQSNEWLGEGRILLKDSDWIRSSVYVVGYVSIASLERVKLYWADGGTDYFASGGKLDLQWVS